MSNLSVDELEKDIRQFCDDPSDPPQPKHTEGMKELEQKLGEVLRPDVHRLYGGKLRCLERFLNARGKDPEVAQKMFQECMQIYAKHPFTRSEPLDDKTRELYEFFFSHWPLKFVGFTEAGHLIIYAKCGRISPKAFLDFTEDQLTNFFSFYNGESMQLQNYGNVNVRPKTKKSWSGTVEIYDLKNLSLKQMHITGLRLLVRVMKMGQKCFPDTLHKSFIINAPWYYAGAWKVVRLGLDKHTREKVTIVSGNARKELEALFGEKNKGMVSDMFDDKIGQKTFCLSVPLAKDQKPPHTVLPDLMYPK